MFEPSFGLSWTMSPEEFSSEFDVVNRESDGELIVLKSSDKSDLLPSNTDFLQVIFWRGRLVKFSWVSDNFTDDIYGSAGKEAYSTLVTVLEEKLGPGEEIEVVGRELWDEPDEFYQCLDYEGCGAWVTFWTNPANENNLAVLQLHGLNRGEGYLMYIVEHPDWYVYSDGRTTDDASKF